MSGSTGRLPDRRTTTLYSEPIQRCRFGIPFPRDMLGEDRTKRLGWIRWILDVEIQRVQADYLRWKQSPSKSIDEARSKAIVTVLDTAFARKPELAARSWSFFRHVLAQREGLAVGRMLQLADACAWDGYYQFRSSAAIAQPIVCLDLIDSPLTYLRTQVRASTRSLQLPLAFVPPRFLSCPWLLTTLHHEVGHTLDVDLGVTREVQLGISGGAIPGSDQALWSQWALEIVCDAYAIAVSGPAFVWSLASVFDALDQWNGWSLGDKHPPAELRIAVGVALARRMRWETADVQPLVDELLRGGVLPRFTGLLAQVDAIAELVLRHLPSPARATDRVQLAQAAETLARGGSVDELPIRIVPAAAQLAVLRSSSRETLQEIDKAFESATTPDWLPSDEEWSQFADRVEKMVGTLGVETGRKIPPQELLIRHDRVAFVAATNHQLAAGLACAFAKRTRKWAELELFFLSDGALRGIDPALVAKKANALDELRDTLSTWAESWQVYEYDTPYYFASYWDVGASSPEGRIHVSPYIWGADISECPAVDHLHCGDPSSAFRMYEAGLAALRASARVLESSRKGS